MAMKFDKKQSAIQKSAKNKQILIKTSPKTSNPQILKKNSYSQKTGPNSRENRNVGNTAEQLISTFLH